MSAIPYVQNEGRLSLGAAIILEIPIIIHFISKSNFADEILSNQISKNPEV
jgi:hypothetical protein